MLGAGSEERTVTASLRVTLTLLSLAASYLTPQQPPSTPSVFHLQGSTEFGHFAILHISLLATPNSEGCSQPTLLPHGHTPGPWKPWLAHHSL